MTEAELLGLPWRVGRKVGRTIYAVPGAGATDTDPLIGLMDTEALARSVVEAHNRVRALTAIGHVVLLDLRKDKP